VLTSRFVIGASDPAGFRDAVADALHDDRDVTVGVVAPLPEIPDSTATHIPGRSPVSSVLFHTALGLPLGLLGIGYGNTVLRAMELNGVETLTFTLGVGLVLGVSIVVPTILIGRLGVTMTLLLLGDCLFLGPLALLLASAWVSDRG
jgi:hypothetical protein